MSNKKHPKSYTKKFKIFVKSKLEFFTGLEKSKITTLFSLIFLLLTKIQVKVIKMGSKTQLKYFILEARTGNELEHKSVDGESEIIKGYQKGFIVGVDKENTRNYVVPKELCSRSENGTVLINGIDTGLKAKTLRNAEKAFPRHILLIVSVSDSYDSVLSKLNTTSMVFYTKKLYELENAAKEQQIGEADYNKLKEEIEDLKNKHVRELLQKQKEHIDAIQKLDEKYKKLLADYEKFREDAANKEAQEKKRHEEIENVYKSTIDDLTGELSQEIKSHRDSRDSLKAMQDSVRGLLMDKSKQKIEIERQKAELERQKSEIEELRKQLKEYQDKEREHNERVAQARENFKKNWVGKGRQPSIRGKDKEKMIIKMRESGVKVKDIAAYMGYSKTTIMTILKANGMTKAYKPRV